MATSEIFHAAVRGVNIELINELIDSKADTNQRGRYDGNTPAQVAVANGDTEIIMILVENKANIHQRSEDGTTPICIAAEKGYLEAINILIEYKAVVSQASNDDYHENRDFPLCLATKNNHIEAMKILINSKANVKGSIFRPNCLESSCFWWSN